MPKTVRFAELVKKAGQPHVVTLWSDPKRDRDFAKAIRENRVLTVKQETVGSKKDFGVTGFREEKNVSYLVFPKPLPQVGDAKVVGIKYDLLKDVPVADRVSVKPSKAARVKRGVTSPGETTQTAIVPEFKRFVATIRRTAVWETTITVEARNKADAEMKVEAMAKSLHLDPAEAVARNEVRDVRQEE